MSTVLLSNNIRINNIMIFFVVGTFATLFYSSIVCLLWSINRTEAHCFQYFVLDVERDQRIFQACSTPCYLRVTVPFPNFTPGSWLPGDLVVDASDFALFPWKRSLLYFVSLLPSVKVGTCDTLG